VDATCVDCTATAAAAAAAALAGALEKQATTPASTCASGVRLPRRRFHAHPGELAAAERWAAAAQRRLAGAAAGAAGAAGGGRGLRVAVSVHTDVTMFILSQPALLQGDGERPPAQRERDGSRRCWSSGTLLPVPGCLYTGARGARPAACQTQLPSRISVIISLTMHGKASMDRGLGTHGHRQLPTRRWRRAGGLVVHAHCYLHRPSLVPFGHRIPVAPHYLLKLKSDDAIRQARPAQRIVPHVCTSALQSALMLCDR
jgi:hypothetical protein